MAIVDFEKALRPYSIVTYSAGICLCLRRSYDWKTLALAGTMILLAIALWSNLFVAIPFYVPVYILILAAILIAQHVWSEFSNPIAIDIQRGYIKFEYGRFLGGRSEKIVYTSQVKGMRPDTLAKGRHGISPRIHFYFLNEDCRTITFTPRGWDPDMVKKAAEAIAGRCSAILDIRVLSLTETDQS
jgi:hypothetical protein